MASAFYKTKIFTSPGFKTTYWFNDDKGIYSENTPLLPDNITDVLSKFTDRCKVYLNLDDYYNNCKIKNIAPQIVGIKDHWLVISERNGKYSFIDATGAPKQLFEAEMDEDLPTNYDFPEQFKIRQSPYSAACGIYAALFCLAHELYRDGMYLWDFLAPNIVNYSPGSDPIKNWQIAYTKPETDMWLHLNDINVFNYYKHLSDY